MRARPIAPVAAAHGLRDDFAAAVLAGLSAPRKRIPCRFLYDARGSELFEAITALEEYYPTRTEIGLLKAHAGEIAQLAGRGVALVEFGSGSSRKTDILIEALPALAAYVPIDISQDALAAATGRLQAKYPDLTVMPLHADFGQLATLPRALAHVPKLGFFPGSTIGNYGHAEAGAFLRGVARLLGRDGALVIGVDLKKDASILLPAYDDAQGVTAAFTLNLLERINRELDGTFDPRRFRHEARYDAAGGRVEINLVSLVDQTAGVLGRRFAFREGERIHVEDSHKYAVPEFQTLAAAAGWRGKRAWCDARALFSVHYLVPVEAPAFPRGRGGRASASE